MIFCSPFLYKGFTLAIFNESGYMLVLSNWFIITLGGSLISCLIAFSLFDNSSTPELFLFFFVFLLLLIFHFQWLNLRLSVVCL